MESSRQASFISNQTAMIVAVGFLGAFTTFSSLTFEVLTYFQRGEWQVGFFHLAMNLLLGLLLTWCGIMLARLFCSGV
jgi:CrcB protein